MRRVRRHLTYSNVMVTLLAFVVLGGGAYAAFRLPKNSVRSRNIKNGQVKNPDLANGAVTSAKLGCKGNGGKDKMVRAGSVCIDKFEASVWSKPNGGAQYGVNGDNYPCSDTGQNCKGKIFARSVKGVKPSGYITWFQAQQALANSHKRLPTSAEWQQAVAGTPDDTGPGTTPCNTRGQVKKTGASAGCVSAWGANDMVGNLGEWVADWVPRSVGCGDWGSFSDDNQCLNDAGTDGEPGAIYRGGGDDGAGAGPFSVNANVVPSNSGLIGFRGVR